MRWIDANAGDALSAGNRGLAYGDGIFESLRNVGGRLRFLDSHLRRLRHGCERLGIDYAGDAVVAERLTAYAAAHRQDDWLKLIVTRGDTARGYASEGAGETCCIIASGQLARVKKALRVRLCDTRLPDEPGLAGLKHLNRLPQVMARREWHADDYDEGIMCDADGNVACGIMSNVFIVRDQKIVTPRLERCGVAGVMRDWLMQQHAVSRRAISVAELLAADEVFLSNALRGIMQVSTIDNWALTAEAPVTVELQRRLSRVTP